MWALLLASSRESLAFMSAARIRQYKTRGHTQAQGGGGAASARSSRPKGHTERSGAQGRRLRRLEVAPSEVELRAKQIRASFISRPGMKVRPDRKLSPGEAIRGLYDAFNARDADAAAAFLDDDCIYEDLLLGPNTVCRGKEAFASALRFHPAFVTSAIFSDIPLTSKLPELRLVVDSVAEGRDCVGVEWHVEVGDSAFPLGRGLSQAKIDERTGKITRVVDIAEAPWRVIGLLLAPFLSVLIVLSELSIFR